MPSFPEEGADVDDVMNPRPHAAFDGVHLATLQQGAEAGLGRLDGRLVELAALEQFDMASLAA